MIHTPLIYVNIKHAMKLNDNQDSNLNPSGDSLDKSRRCFSMLELNNIPLIHELNDEIDAISDGSYSIGENPPCEEKDKEDSFLFFEDMLEDDTLHDTTRKIMSLQSEFHTEAPVVRPCYEIKRSISFTGFRGEIHTDKLVSAISALARDEEAKEEDKGDSFKSRHTINRSQSKKDVNTREDDILRKQENKLCQSLRPTKSLLKNSCEKIYVNKKLMRNYSSKDLRNFLQFDDSSTSLKSESSQSSSNHKSTKMKKTISFSTLEVRNYDVTLGDNPGVSNGPPVSLDWTYEDSKHICLEEYESLRPPRRSKEEMRLDSNSRQIVLSSRFTSRDLKAATDTAREIRMQRRKSYSISNMEPLQEVLESTERKMKRLLRRRRKDSRDFI